MDTPFREDICFLPERFNTPSVLDYNTRNGGFHITTPQRVKEYNWDWVQVAYNVETYICNNFCNYIEYKYLYEWNGCAYDAKRFVLNKQEIQMEWSFFIGCGANLNLLFLSADCFRNNLIRENERETQDDNKWNKFNAPVKSKSKVPNRQITPALRFKILHRDGYCCGLCGRSKQDGVKLEVDHKVPVSKGGNDTEDNLWTLCYDCNRGKSNKYSHECHLAN